MNRRAIVIVLDSVGIGALPDAANYGDAGSNTLGHIAEERPLHLPHLKRLGLGNIAPLKGIEPEASPLACYGRMAERSAGKDTTTGHWEIAGLILDKPFPTFPNGFPPEFIQAYEEAIGRKTLGNVVASGTEIIQRLGDEHVRTGFPIVYTSADSVFQVAAHEEVIPLAELMRICQIAREMLTGDLKVGRVIARPFLGEKGNYRRTPNRHDFALLPLGETMLDKVLEAGMSVRAIGKIRDIYAGKGVSQAQATKGNEEGVEKILEFMLDDRPGLIMANLVDFDMLYGHRNDVEGYAKALEAFDARLPEILEALGEDDLLVITADHGCDPTTESTDHSREYVPLLIFGPKLKRGINLGIRQTFADVGATVVDYLGAGVLANGVSFWPEIRNTALS